MSIDAPNTTLGHLGLVLPYPAYTSINTAAWADPTAPSDTPAKPTTNQTTINPFKAQEVIRA